MENLGCRNGWKEKPVKVVICMLKKHQIEEKTIGRCKTEFSCKVCDYKFTVDSGG